MNYVLCGAQQKAGALGYSPLPKNLVVGGFQQIDHVPGHVADAGPEQLNGCNNPTYSRRGEHLIKDAPYAVAVRQARRAADLRRRRSHGRRQRLRVGSARLEQRRVRQRLGGTGTAAAAGQRATAPAPAPGGPARPAARIDPETGLPVNGSRGATGASNVAALGRPGVAAEPGAQQELAARRCSPTSTSSPRSLLPGAARRVAAAAPAGEQR